MEIELSNAEELILGEIADPNMTRDAVAVTYAFMLWQRQGHDYDWRRVNRAIMERWSLSALEYIKGKAWKRCHEKADG